jgi:hypothetical protein
VIADAVDVGGEVDEEGLAEHGVEAAELPGGGLPFEVVGAGEAGRGLVGEHEGEGDVDALDGEVAGVEDQLGAAGAALEGEADGAGEDAGVEVDGEVEAHVGDAGLVGAGEGVGVGAGGVQGGEGRDGGGRGDHGGRGRGVRHAGGEEEGGGEQRAAHGRGR